MGDKTVARKKRSSADLQQCVNKDAAGIDLGSRSHFVALPKDRKQKVREFSCNTADLEAMAAYLHEHRITTVAMEATGVYWVPVYQILETAGLDVNLVNSRHLKMVPGRKTDVGDSQWLQLLHEAGLLRGSFRPPDDICAIRSLLRHRDTLVAESSRHLLRMQKALEQMNVQLHKTVSRIAGDTGMAIIKDIVDGERDPYKLAAHRHRCCRKSTAEFAEALRGDWRAEHLFCLQEEFGIYQYYQARIVAANTEIQRRIALLPQQGAPTDLPAPTKKKMDLPVRLNLFEAVGHDVTAIEGIGTLTWQKLLGEIGTDVSAWPTVKHFTSWAQVCADNNITGGKRRRAKFTGSKNRVAQMFRDAAATLYRADTALGAFFRRKKAARGPQIAIGATAHKLAQRFYYMLKHGAAYIPLDADHYEQKHRDRMARNAVKTLQRIGRADLLALPEVA